MAGVKGKETGISNGAVMIKTEVVSDVRCHCTYTYIQALGIGRCEGRGDRFRMEMKDEHQGPEDRPSGV